ncbi:MAG: sigma factor-like helix-turn-helix DNA-binding protein [Candidatus Moranbacteria bacterium]|nr:sigma factor-like helix-turn-helix DNA-binding protein [Candidatus Moranbacteria bacterium]
MQKSNKSGVNEAKNSKSTFLDLAGVLLSGLPQRSQEIVKKRFGLADGKIETLEKIGSSYGITRERVRQIITYAVKKVSESSESVEFKQAEEKIILEISRKDGIMNEEKLIGKLGSGNLSEANAVIFFAVCSNRILGIEEKGLTKKSWALSKDVLAKVKEVSAIAKEILVASNTPLTDAEMVARVIARKKEFTKNQILSHLDVLTEISRNKFGRWGFSKWMEINPKGTRERIHLVLKEGKKPLHFTEIAKLIDESGISKRKSHPQTVHNELIKDSRFVLIGRGIYALREWGYTPGAIKDVLEEILKKSGRAMTKEEILTEVDRLRQVKKTTVMINLNNSGSFAKVDGKYDLKDRRRVL